MLFFRGLFLALSTLPLLIQVLSLIILSNSSLPGYWSGHKSTASVYNSNLQRWGKVLHLRKRKLSWSQREWRKPSKFSGIFHCLCVSWWISALLWSLRDMKDISQNSLFYWHLCIQKLRISPGGGLTGEKRGKITNKVENVKKKTLSGRCWRVRLSFSLSSHIIQRNSISKGFHCDGFKLVWRKRFSKFLG